MLYIDVNERILVELKVSRRFHSVNLKGMANAPRVKQREKHIKGQDCTSMQF